MQDTPLYNDIPTEAGSSKNAVFRTELDQLREQLEIAQEFIRNHEISQSKQYDTIQVLEKERDALKSERNDKDKRIQKLEDDKQELAIKVEVNQ